MPRLPVPPVVMFRGQPWKQTWSDARNYRPDPDGHQRDERYPNVRWEGSDGRVHQANGFSNQALCEQGYGETLVFEMVAPTTDRVNCIRCMGYPSWPDYPID